MILFIHFDDYISENVLTKFGWILSIRLYFELHIHQNVAQKPLSTILQYAVVFYEINLTFRFMDQKFFFFMNQWIRQSELDRVLISSRYLIFLLPILRFVFSIAALTIWTWRNFWCHIFFWNTNNLLPLICEFLLASLTLISIEWMICSCLWITYYTNVTT